MKSYIVIVFAMMILLTISGCQTPEDYCIEGDKQLEYRNFDEAEKLYNQAIEADPNYIYAYAGIARLYLAQKKHLEALESSETLVNLCEKSNNFRDLATAYQLRCLIYVDMKDFSNGLIEITKAIEILETNNARVRLGFAYKMRSAVHEKLGNKEKAASDKQISDKYYNE